MTLGGVIVIASKIDSSTLPQDNRAMGILFTCDRCGTQFTSGAIQIENSSAYLANNRVNCPKPSCEGWGHHAAGEYTFVGGVLKAFTAAGMTREKVVAARQVAEEASSGTITTDEAVARLEAISAELLSAMRAGTGKRFNWELLLALLTLILGPISIASQV